MKLVEKEKERDIETDRQTDRQSTYKHKPYNNDHMTMGAYNFIFTVTSVALHF